MSKTRRQTLLVLGLYVLLTLLMTFPLVLNMGTHVRDHGDPLLNAWILAWNNRQAVRMDLSGWFDTNIYFPHSNTLAYSEHLFPQSLVALPVQLLSGNPVLAYNFVLLFGFVTTALGMYFLARRLTGHLLGSITAGFIFAFSPFMIAHLFHLQVLTAAGIPLVFLFLIRFFDQGRWKDLLLLTLFYVLQSLANGYYALYLTLMAGLFILIMTLVRRKWKEGSFWVQMGVFAALSAAAIGPFLYKYYQVKSLLGLQRGIGGARLTSYLATSPLNIIYGRITERFRIGEGELFPGIVVVLLGVAGALTVLKLRKTGLSPIGPAPKPMARALLWSLAGLMVAVGYVIYRVLLKGGFEMYLGAGFKVHSRSLIKPLLFLVFLLVVYQVLKRSLRAGPLLGSRTMDPVAWTFLLILILAFLMTFGSSGPYLLLSRYLPGFEGLRAAARSHVFVMLPLALFAAFGLRQAASRLKGLAKKAVLVLAPLIVLAEYLSLPVAYQSIPVKKDIPAVYQWLASQENEFALLEFPLPRESKSIGSLECPRIYYSAYHWKRLANGFSGYIPPLYYVLRDRWDGQAPLSQNLLDLKALGVRYVVVHTAQMPADAVPFLMKEFASRQDQASFVGKFGEALVYEVRDWEDGLRHLNRPSPPLERIDPRGWKCSASVNEEALGLALDGDGKTRWDTAGNQQPGQFFQVDLGRTVRLSVLRLVIAASERDYPRGYRVEVSVDGRTWTTAAQSDRVFVDIRAYLKPRDLALEIPLSGVSARAVRIVNTGRDPIYYWSIHELEIYSPPI